LKVAAIVQLIFVVDGTPALPSINGGLWMDSASSAFFLFSSVLPRPPCDHSVAIELCHDF
jgi:hypothetical protein